MKRRNIGSAASILATVLLATGCANVGDVANDVGKEVASLMADAGAHRKVEVKRVAADARRIDNLGRLGGVQDSYANADRAVLAMTAAKSSGEAWQALDAYLASVDERVLAQGLDAKPETEAGAKLPPLPTALMATVAKELEGLSKTDRKADLAAIITYGKSIQELITKLGNAAAKAPGDS